MTDPVQDAIDQMLSLDQIQGMRIESVHYKPRPYDPRTDEKMIYSAIVLRDCLGKGYQYPVEGVVFARQIIKRIRENLPFVANEQKAWHIGMSKVPLSYWP